MGRTSALSAVIEIQCATNHNQFVTRVCEHFGAVQTQRALVRGVASLKRRFLVKRV